MPRASALPLISPSPQVIGIKAHAEQIGWNETELSGSHANDADDDTVDCRDHPTVPQPLANQNRREHSQQAGYVV
jgi:hypothetical protein